MANTQLLKRRIKTAQNVSKTTKAMQMIAASKLKRAQEATLCARPYVKSLTTISQNVVSKIKEDQKHPYMIENTESDKTLLIVISPDKGLCGGLITNLVRDFLKLEKDNLYVVGVGKKIEKYVIKLGEYLVATFPFGTTLPTFDMVYALSTLVDDYFLNKKVRDVKILGVHFDSIFTQRPQLTTLIPIRIEESEQKDGFALFEPSLQELLPSLLKHRVEMVLYQHLLESFVSEQASRMIAMQNATDNAKDIIRALTLEYNKARQERITNEILDISSGANAIYA